MHISIVPLGAGQDVGRSCILMKIGGKNIMFDCGMHMGYQDERCVRLRVLCVRMFNSFGSMGAFYNIIAAEKTKICY